MEAPGYSSTLVADSAESDLGQSKCQYLPRIWWREEEERAAQTRDTKEKLEQQTQSYKSSYRGTQ